MNATLPRYIYGLCLVNALSLLLICLSFFHAWQRPVTAISGIPFRSEIIDLYTGRIYRLPAVKYQANLQIDDYIVSLAGLSWYDAQRLNIHELSPYAVGEYIPLQIKRSGKLIQVSLMVGSPDIWEQIVLFRFSISAFISWIPTTLILRALIRQLKHHDHDHSGVALWFLTWQALSIFLSIGSLKYPIAFLWTDVLGRIIPLYGGYTSYPYPIAPRKHRARRLGGIVFFLAILSLVLIIWNAHQFNSPLQDWRYSVRLMRSTDAVSQGTLPIVIFGFSLAIFGTCTTAFSHALGQGLHKTGDILRTLFGERRIIHRFQYTVDRFNHLYATCDPAITVIARFQLMIVLIYLFLEIWPRAIGLAGNSYSMILPALPMAYLLLYDTLPEKEIGQRWLYTIITIVSGVQFFTLTSRWQNNTFGMGAVEGDWIAIFVIGGGLIAWRINIMWLSWRTKYRSGTIHHKLDVLFTATSREEFWKTLIESIGSELNMTNWIWLKQQQGSSWIVIQNTSSMNPTWLNELKMNILLDESFPQKPLNVTSGITHYPVNLTILPSSHITGERDILIAINPQGIQTGLKLIKDSVITMRIIHALNALWHLEQQQMLTDQQHRLVAAYQQLERKQAIETRNVSHKVVALLHDKPLQRLPLLSFRLQGLAEKHTHTSLGRQLHICATEAMDINNMIEQTIKGLRLQILQAGLIDTTWDLIDIWEDEYPHIRFEIDLCDEPTLSQDERELIFLIIRQSVENALEHAQPTQIRVSFIIESHGLKITIEDDGIGFTYDAVKVESLGLTLMHDIAHTLHGCLEVDTQPSCGCRITLIVPLHQSSNKNKVEECDAHDH